MKARHSKEQLARWRRVRIIGKTFPAVIFPLATAWQLSVAVLRSSAGSLDPTTWLLFLVANLGALGFVGWFPTDREGRIERLQGGLSFGLTALLDALIVGAILCDRFG